MNHNIIATTADLKEDYKIISPIIFSFDNQPVLFSSKTKLNELLEKYKLKTEKMLSAISSHDEQKTHLDFFYAILLNKDNPLEQMFYIGVEELKLRAEMLHADAIIGISQEVTSHNHPTFFNYKIYGTAVKIMNKQ